MDYTIYVNNVCLNLQKVRDRSIHTSDRSVHRSNSVQATGFSPTLKIWSQKAPKIVSDIKKLKSFQGEHAPRPP